MNQKEEKYLNKLIDGMVSTDKAKAKRWQKKVADSLSNVLQTKLNGLNIAPYSNYEGYQELEIVNEHEVSKTDLESKAFQNLVGSLINVTFNKVKAASPAYLGKSKIIPNNLGEKIGMRAEVTYYKGAANGTMC